MKKIWLVLTIVCVFVLSSCGDNGKTPTKVEEPDEAPVESDDSEEVPDAEVPEEEPTDNNAEFDPEHPGYTVEFNIIDIDMMGQGQSMAIGYFMKTAREDLEEGEVVDVTLDTCVMGESSPRVPSCTSKADCAPEQECVPEYDNQSGQAIENSEHCETPNRASLDVGPVEIAGFNGGPYPFAYEPGDQVYKMNGTGDGSIDRSLIAYGVDYTIRGENMLPDDLNSLSATFRMPPALQLIEPAATEGGTFGAAIAIDNSKPLKFVWEGNGGQGYIDITITAAQSLANTVSVTCKVIDDGEFTVPEEFASQLVFGGGGDGIMDQMLAMMNMIIFDRHTESPITGDGISVGKVSSEQLIMANVLPTNGYTPEPTEPEPTEPEPTAEPDPTEPDPEEPEGE